MPTLRYYGAQEEDGRGVPEAAPSVLSCPPPVRFPTGVIEPLPPPAAVQAINTRTAVPTPPRVPVVTPTNVAAAGRLDAVPGTKYEAANTTHTLATT